MPSFTTGPTLLPDIGQLTYNGCSFGPLFASKLNCKFAQDDAGRNVKYTEIELMADGYVTLAGTGAASTGASISPTMANMHRLLTAQGGSLAYVGRGFNLTIGSSLGKQDVRWGPRPEIIDFQPLGGGLSAKVVWKVTVCICGTPQGTGFELWGRTKGSKKVNILQLTYDTSVTYEEDGFSRLSIQGSLEIPLSRADKIGVGKGNQVLDHTADDLRNVVEERVMAGIDLVRFRVTNRTFDLSRDKRTLSWDITAVEKPYMDLPPGCTIAKGSYDVVPSKVGPGLALWLCSLSVTYTLRADIDRRYAYELFLSFMRLRMMEAQNGNVPGVNDGAQAQAPVPRPQNAILAAALAAFGPFGAAAAPLFVPRPVNIGANKLLRSILIDFRASEGLHLDSKSITFKATWKITTTFSHIILASGLWKKWKETNDKNENLWGLSMADVSGANSWLYNRLDPELDVVVDFGT